MTFARYEPDLGVSDDDSPVATGSCVSVTGRSVVPAGAFTATTPNELFTTYRNQYPDHRRRYGRGDNRINPIDIQHGRDVRTTVMLRNIPNRVDVKMLKALVDMTSHGAYDFMYLRIDFANNCNVGYAFINFIDPLAITPFAAARQGKRWAAFNSDKIAEISYAS